MRLGVLDIGSNTVHLLVVEAGRGERPRSESSHRTALRLAERIDQNGRLPEPAVTALVKAVARAKTTARRMGATELLVVATSAVRQATNSAAVLDRISAQTGLAPVVLSGETEAALTFLAVRRWYGWSAGRLLVLDIGGGSLEIAAGDHEQPDIAISLPLGAGRLTHDWIDDERSEQSVARLRAHVRQAVETVAPKLISYGWDRVVGTSGTLRTLGQLAGVVPATAKTAIPHLLTRTEIRALLGLVAGMSSATLAGPAGVSRHRVHQLLAGTVVAEEVTRQLALDSVQLCPWALRQGVVLRYLESGLESGLGRSAAFLAHHESEQRGSPSGDGSATSQSGDRVAAGDRTPERHT